MRRGKRFLEKDNLFIYVGTTIFFILAIALGIIMYMTSRTANKIKNESGQVVQESKVDETVENTEKASTDIGKTIKEQENSENEEKNTNTVNKQDSNSVTTNKEIGNANSTKVENTSSNKKDTKTGNNPVDEPDKIVPAKEEVPETKKDITFIKPVEGDIICEYAKDNLIYSETLKEWITHTAVDIKADKTSVIKAAADGVVKTIVNDPRYGLTIIISHDDGYETIYSNLLTAEFVVEGEEVSQGQTIGTAGNTAAFESSMESHLHFELLKDEEYLDPTIYLK